MTIPKLSVFPAWAIHTTHASQLDPAIFPLLQAVRETEKLTEAAKFAGISYRHAWNLLHQLGEALEFPIVVRQRGRGTRLSDLGERVLLAEQRVRARLGPQLDSMASEINDEIQKVVAGRNAVLRINASHGYAISLLPQHNDQVEINLQYRNPQEALLDLLNGRCDISSFHFPTCPFLAKRVLDHYESELNRAQLKLIRFVKRKEGLMMKPSIGPLKSLKELTESNALFIRRDTHSGTRILFDLLMEREKLTLGAVNCTSHYEYTHTAIAACVAAGMADVGFGVEAAANQFGLSFSELAEEHYLLACREENLKLETVQDLIGLIQSKSVLDSVENLPGYCPDSPGEITTFDELLSENQGYVPSNHVAP